MSVQLVDLDGVTVARLTKEAGRPVTLVLSAPSGFIGENYYPAESITISDEGVRGLYALLQEAYAKPVAGLPLPPLPEGAKEQKGGWKL